MDLDDLLEGNELKQDKWSLLRSNFGENEQLQVVGYLTKSVNGHKYYILKCSECSKDVELFGNGYFKALKQHLLKNNIPCGCSIRPRWSKEQYITLCTRKAEELGYKFTGFAEERIWSNSRIKMLCEKHGEWNSNTVSNLLNHDCGCLGCKWELNTKPDDVMIASFFASGAFHPETKFWRSDRKTYWYVFCPECSVTAEAFCGHLQYGKRSCACSKHRQQEAYINWVLDSENNAIAIKFGIARDSGVRCTAQDKLSAFTVKPFLVYQFVDTTSCKKAERECKEELDCGVLTKEEMQDGYTETTNIGNFLKIIDIYKRNGGWQQINCIEEFNQRTPNQ